jgi:1-deoxy-D-xylulose-5-phosphate reductoisomerase
MKKKVVILGSTGSIGTQTIDVIASNTDKFELFGITAHSNSELLISQARKYKPNFVIVTKDECYPIVKEALSNEDIKVFAGIDSVCDLVSMPSVDVVVTAMVGYAGLKPTISAVKASKTIALANKETLVVAGELIKDLALKHHSPILPVDSEHSAIFQCLAGEINNPIEKIILTASGGPFRKHSLEELKYVTKADALKHPNWDMGAKITIDSASMMNKGFEVIEAKWLFDLNIDQIDVLVHPQSIVHSMVQFTDGSIKAHFSPPSMTFAISHSLLYGKRGLPAVETIDFTKPMTLDFAPPDTQQCRSARQDKAPRSSRTGNGKDKSQSTLHRKVQVVFRKEGQRPPPFENTNMKACLQAQNLPYCILTKDNRELRFHSCR